MKRAIFLLLLLITSACDYRFQDDAVVQKKTVSINYAEGDYDGRLTSALSRALVNTPLLLVNSGGEFTLDVKIIDDSKERIGYRFNRKGSKRSKGLTDVESRREITAEVKLMRTCSKEVAFGPYTVRASADYDYIDPNALIDVATVRADNAQESSLRFSGGQLDSIEAASDYSLDALYRKLANQIVRGIAYRRLIVDQECSK